MSKSIHHASHTLLRTILVQRRKELGWSQARLAAKLDRPQSFIAKIEIGERRIDVIEFLDIAHALNLDPCDVLGEIDNVHH